MSYHSLTTHFNPPALLSPSAVHGPTTSLNPLLFCPNSPSPFRDLNTKIANSSIAIVVPPLWNKLLPVLRQISDPSYEIAESSPLAISPQVFHSKVKTLLFHKSHLDSSYCTQLPGRFKHHLPQRWANFWHIGPH